MMTSCPVFDLAIFSVCLSIIYHHKNCRVNKLLYIFIIKKFLKLTTSTSRKEKGKNKKWNVPFPCPAATMRCSNVKILSLCLLNALIVSQQYFTIVYAADAHSRIPIQLYVCINLLNISTAVIKYF